MAFVPQNGNIDVPIESLELSVRTSNSLKNSPYRTVLDLARASKSDLLKIPGFGAKSAKEIAEVLAAFCRPAPALISLEAAWADEHPHLIRALMAGEALVVPCTTVPADTKGKVAS